MKWALALLAILMFPDMAIAGSEQGRVLIFTMDQVEWNDLEQSPILSDFRNNAAFGLLHTGSSSRTDGYVSIGSGARVRDIGDREILGAEEPLEGGTAEEVYVRRGGKPGGAVYHLGIWSLQRENPASQPVGVLGQALSDANIEAGGVANGDTPGRLWRAALSIVMDRQGVVRKGEVSPGVLIEYSPEAPFGLQDNHQGFIDSIRQLGGVSVLVVGPGDTHRAELYRQNVSDSVAYALRERSALRALDLLGNLIQDMDFKKDVLMLLVPAPGPDAVKASSGLTPVVFLGNGFKPGLLTSPSTRSEGIVLANDLAPTILSFFGLETPITMTGRPIISLPHANALDFIKQLEYAILRNHRNRPGLIRTYILLQIFMLSLGTAWLFWRFPGKSLIQTLLLGLTLVPLSFLSVSGMGLDGAFAYVMSFGAPIVVACLLRSLSKDIATPFALAALLTAVVIVMDQILGFNLTRDTPLGNSTVGGARFFGLGNEYAGLLIGASLTGGTAFLGRTTRRSHVLILGLFLLLVAVLMGSGRQGANFGGALSAVFAFSYTVFTLSGMGKRSWFLSLIMVLLGLAGFFAFESTLVLAEKSHIGIATSKVWAEGPSYAWEIYVRKMSMNLRLLRYTIWSRVLITSLITFAISLRFPRGVFATLTFQRPALMAGIKGTTLGSFFALLANDSGVVAAATTMIFASITLLGLAMEEASLSGTPSVFKCK